MTAKSGTVEEFDATVGSRDNAYAFPLDFPVCKL